MAQQVDDLLTGKTSLMCCSSERDYWAIKSTLADISEVVPFQALMQNDSITAIWADHGVPIWILCRQFNYGLIDVESLLASRAAAATCAALIEATHPLCDIDRTRLYAKYSSAHRMALKEWEAQQFSEDDNVPELTSIQADLDKHNMQDPELSRSILNAAYKRGREHAGPLCPRDQNCVRENPYVKKRCDCMDMTSPGYGIRPCWVDADLKIEIKLSSLNELVYTKAVYKGATLDHNKRRGIFYPADVIDAPLRPHKAEQYAEAATTVLEASLENSTASLSGAGPYEASTALYVGFVRLQSLAL